MALTLAVVCAGESGVRPPGQDAAQSPSAESQVPAADTMARYQGLVVEEIRWPNVVSPSDQKRWSQLIPQKPGSPLDRDLIRQSIRDLYGTGRFADIRVEADKTGEGTLVLSFVTTPNYFVGEIRVEGAPHRPTAGQIVNSSK